MHVPNLKFSPIDSRILVYLVTLACNMFLFALVFYSKGNRELFLNIFSFTAVAILSCLFIRSLYKCTHQHEEMNVLTKNLIEIQTSLELIEKKRARFFSALTENFRTPLQVMYGYSSMILEGAFGTPSEEVRGFVEKIFMSIGEMMKLIEKILSTGRSEKVNTEWSRSKNGLTQMDSWRTKNISLRFLMAIGTVTLLIQIVLATTASNVFIIAFITILGMFAGLFLTNEIKFEPGSDDAMKNLIHDLGIAREKLEFLEQENESLLSSVSINLRTPLVMVIDEAWQLSQGNRGEISDKTREVVTKISEMKESLNTAVTELVNMLDASK